MLSSHSDYWPFGYPLQNRNSNLHKYRFGFQGQEKDNEWTGQQGSHLNYKYRVHDARIGRFLSVDPLTAKYPHNSPYAFSENRVIDRIELEGLESCETQIAMRTNRSLKRMTTGRLGSMRNKKGSPVAFSYEEIVQRSDEKHIQHMANSMAITGAVSSLIVLDYATTGGTLTREYAKNLFSQMAVQVAVGATKNIFNEDNANETDLLTNAAKKLDFFDAFVGSSESIGGRIAGIVLASGVDFSPEGLSTVFDGDKELGQFGYDLIGNAIAEALGHKSGQYGNAVRELEAYVSGLIDEGMNEKKAIKSGMEHIRESMTVKDESSDKTE